MRRGTTASPQDRVARNVKRLRALKGISQEELAAEAGLGCRHLQRIESGHGNVTLNTLSMLAVALGVDASELLVEERTSR
jgi:transcriptional regulator with XRE-family HTH domain